MIENKPSNPILKRFKFVRSIGLHSSFTIKAITVILIAFLLLPLITNSQPDGYIKPGKFNNHLLEHYTKKLIDSVRRAHELSALTNDSVLYLASKDHANYLKNKSPITHLQDIDKKATPHLRIEFYGGTFRGTGENIARIFVHRKTQQSSGQTTRISTYKEAARALVEGWVNSPGHYRNIIKEAYSITGIAINYNRNNDTVTAVQTFGAVSEDYAYDKTNSRYFPYRDQAIKQEEKNSLERFFDRMKKGIKLRWHALKNQGKVTDPNLYYDHKHHDFGISYEPDCETCKQFKRKSDSRQRWELYLEDTAAYLWWGDYYKAERAFDDRRDGLVLEVVPFSYYSCDTSLYETIPRRSNGGCAFNGKINKPRYKRKIFDTLYYQNNKKDKKPENFFPFLGIVPDKNNELFEVNVLSLRDNRICRITQFTNIKGSLLNYRDSVPPLPFNFEWDTVAYHPKLPAKFERVKIYFDPKETQVDEDKLMPIKKLLQNKNQRVEMVKTEAYASIEGNKKENSNLFKERAANVIHLLNLDNQDSIRIRKHQSENWERLSAQLDKNHFSFLKGLKHSRIRKFVNRPGNRRNMEALLDAQRFVRVIARYKTRVTKDNIHKFALKEYMDIFHTLKSEYFGKYNYRLPPKLLQRLATIYKFLLQEHQKNHLNYRAIDTLPVSPDPEEQKRSRRDIPMAELKKLKYRYQLQFMRDSLSKADYISHLKFLKKPENTSTAVKFNYKTHQINRINSKHPEEKNIRKLGRFLRQNRNAIPRQPYENMKLFYHFLKANKAYYENPFGTRAHHSMKYIFNHFPVDNLSLDQRIEFARYFGVFHKWEYALKILKPYTKEEQFNESAYKLWAIIKYGRYKSRDSFDYYKALIHARKKLSKQAWCELFTAKERVNFQVLDYKPLRYLYCKTCGSGE